MTAWEILGITIITLSVMLVTLAAAMAVSERVSGSPVWGMALWGLSCFVIVAHFQSGGNWSIP